MTGVGWSDPTVRRLVRAVVAGVRGQLTGRDREAQPGRDQLAELIAGEIRRLRTDQPTAVPSGIPADEVGRMWTTVRHAALAELDGLGRLQPLLDDPDVQDVHVNGCDRVFVVRRGDGRAVAVEPVADSDDDLLELGRAIARRHGREGEQEWSETQPVAEVTLASGHRVELVRDVTARPSLTIRRPDLTLRHLSQLVALGSLHETVAGLLGAGIRAGLNVLVAGGTGAGKTTTMRCLLNEISPHERVVTIEDVLELGLTDPSMVDRDGGLLHPNAVAIATRTANAEGAGGFSLAAGLRTSKRMDPDRLVVGEVRSVEAADMIDAMIGEAGGTVCTIHAASARAALDRLEYLAANTTTMSETTARRMIADAVDVVCWQRHDVVSGRRYVAELVEVERFDAGDHVVRLHDIYRIDRHGRLSGDGPSSRLRTRLADHGWQPATGLRVVE